MNRWIKTTAAAVLFAGAAAVAVGQDAANKPQRPEKENRDMKELRLKSEQLKIDRINYAVKEGRVDKDRAAFMIKQIRSMSAFKNDNPDWVKYSRFGKGGRRGGQQGGCPMMMGQGRKGGCPMTGQGRQGMHSGRNGGRRGMQHGGDMHKKMMDWRKNLTSETEDMKKLRHQARDLKIARIQFAVKQGFVAADQADFMLKKLRTMCAFKDQNPDWVKYGRGCMQGQRGGKGQHGGMRDGKGPHKGMHGDR